MQTHIVNPTIEFLMDNGIEGDTIECNFKTYNLIKMTEGGVLIERILHNRKINLYIERTQNPDLYLVDLSVIDKDDTIRVTNYFDRKLRVAQLIHFLGYRGIKLINEVFCPT